MGIESKPEYLTSNSGLVEVIVGPMFSGKSDELIKRVIRAPYAKKKAIAFTPQVDNRRDKDTINSNDGGKYPAVTVASSKEILEFIKNSPGVDWVAIDEAQFFDMQLPDVCRQLANMGIRVMVAGLAADFRNETFGPMDELVRDAEIVDKLNAHCTVCGGVASRTQRIVNGQPANFNDPVVVVGAEEAYEARCSKHHIVKGKYE